MYCYVGAKALTIMRMIRFAGIREVSERERRREDEQDPSSTQHTNYYDCIRKTGKHAIEGKWKGKSGV